jgi:hypothetical protein
MRCSASPFIYDGLWHRALSTYAGESDTGKSLFIENMVLAFLRGDDQFLGRPLLAGRGGPSERVGWIGTDPDWFNELVDRAGDLGLDIDQFTVVHEDMTDRTPEEWRTAIGRLHQEGIQTLVVDNLSGVVAADGNISDNSTSRPYLHVFGWAINELGLSILLIHHTKKTGKGNYRPDEVGSQTIQTASRHRVFLKRGAGETRMLTTRPNAGPAIALRLRLDYPSFLLEEDITGKKRTRDMDADRAVAQRLLESPPEDRVSQAALARWAYENLGGRPTTKAWEQEIVRLKKQGILAIEDGLVMRGEHGPA